MIEERADALPCFLDGALFGFPDEGLELGEHHLDGVEVRAVGRQEEEMGSNLADGLAGSVRLVAPEIIKDDDVARRQGGNEGLFDPGGEGGAVDRAVQHEGRHDPVVAQPGQEGERLPMAVWHLGEIGLTTRTPTARAGHVGLHPGFIDEDQTLGVDLMLMGFPAGPEPSQFRPILFLGQQCFF